MSRSRLRRLLPVVAASTVPLVYGRWVRPRLLTWGATPDEASARYDGDDLVPHPDGSSTMATTLPAPPETVWAWLAQMGFDRAGWYSWDRMDRGGEPSADRIVPEWQHLAEGQHLNATPDGQAWFTVAVADPPHTLVLRSEIELPSGHSFEARPGHWPQAYLDGIWAFHLRPAAGGGTRLVVRTRGRGRPLRFTRPFNLVVGEPAHFIMQTRQFHNLRARVAAA